MLKATVEVAQRFCSLLVCGYGRKNNEFLIAAAAASFDSSQNRCVVTPNVIYRKECQEKNIPHHEHVDVRTLTFGHTFALLFAPILRRSGDRLVKSGPSLRMILLCTGCVFYASI